MHLENLKIFTDLVETESFSKAGRLNGITQSAVSQQLRSMEKQLDITIVDRSTKHFRLTPEGALLHQSAKQILECYLKLQNDLMDMRNVVNGVIQVSTIYSIGLHDLPPFMRNFLQKYPQVNVRVEYRRSNMVYDDVLQNSVDVGLVAYPVRHRKIEIVPILEEKLVVACSPAHEFANRDSVRLADLNGQKLIGFDQDYPTRKATDAIFKEARINVNVVKEMDNIETVKQAVEINAGIALLPLGSLGKEVSSGRIKAIPVGDRDLVRPMALIYKRGRVLTPALRAFISTLLGRPYQEISGGKHQDDEA